MKNKDLEFKGTKGEWRVQHDINVLSINDRPICACGTFDPKEKKSQNINKANAQLIAAAPELLEALVNLLKQTPEELRKDWLWGECDAAQKAINKALGHEN